MPCGLFGAAQLLLSASSGKEDFLEVTYFSRARVRSACPYPSSVSAGTRTHIRDISSPDLHPRDWASLGSRKPPLEHFTDMAIYELHVRDFSATDPSVPEALRGTFLAFGQVRDRTSI